MKIVKQTKNGIGYLIGLLKEKPRVITRAVFWKIPHKTEKQDVCLKVGRYNKSDGFVPETLDCENPKSELTLDNEELDSLLTFISENYEPFKKGIQKYIPIDEKFDEKNIAHVKAIFDNPDKEKVLDLILENGILPEDILAGLENRVRMNSISEFEEMLKNDLVEYDWQKWFTKNQWVLGSDIVEVLDERHIDTANITDYLVEAHDGFLDIIEIKRPEGDLKFWNETLDHGNCVPSSDLTKATTQAIKYIYEIERESNSIKFIEKVGIKTIKPRCMLIFGRSNDWNNNQKESYRILNSSYHNVSILTYDHVLARAKRILNIKDIPKIIKPTPVQDVNVEDAPF
jgi:hypothetical protein